jgi:signal transduction histidine kinase
MHIADDGVGFRPDDVWQSGRGHLGLPGMRARAKKLRGTFEIVSAPGQGTSLHIEVPIQENQNAFLDTEAHSRG